MNEVGVHEQSVSWLQRMVHLRGWIQGSARGERLTGENSSVGNASAPRVREHLPHHVIVRARNYASQTSLRQHLTVQDQPNAAVVSSPGPTSLLPSSLTELVVVPRAVDVPADTRPAMAGEAAARILRGQAVAHVQALRQHPLVAERRLVPLAGPHQLVEHGSEPERHHLVRQAPSLVQHFQLAGTQVLPMVFFESSLKSTPLS
mmetsp:Transcript_28139/g.77492  ORF Transcript_28139/g.77492 Transcript_28139/m.77492 type:complete len:204 (-) Transcript_28139:366-977(-)